MSDDIQHRQLASVHDRPLLLPTSQQLKILVFLSCVLYCAESIAQSGRQKLPEPGGTDQTLNAILDRLEPNVLDYRRSIPNLFCTEKAEIVRVAPREGSGIDPSANVPWDPSSTVEVSQRRESTFRMQRLSPEGTAGIFEESRVVNLVDGKPPTKTNTSEASLAIVYGVFSNGLNILSKEGMACYAFSIHSQKKNEIQVDFADRPDKERGTNCAKEEKASGRIFVDSAFMHVTRIVTRVPHRQLVPGLFGSWEWSEEFAPVKLSNREFWLPSNIHSRSASDDRVHVWKLTAHYGEYRLFHADARIVPSN
ncbi:hypothetical protein HDF16_003524 [Granulicella aggregans]|uniref:Uncharacterized protein n=1 Tax=Granulicella aggregans TaxID=474949 RepID=A0A7W7ZF61_9BACT|nr:hypothetical protein [Granulicella aggregans]MBB5058810.1 hypothetical protein [Granulicella aggregans]